MRIVRRGRGARSRRRAHLQPRSRQRRGVRSRRPVDRAGADGDCRSRARTRRRYVPDVLRGQDRRAGRRRTRRPGFPRRLGRRRRDRREARRTRPRRAVARTVDRAARGGARQAHLRRLAAQAGRDLRGRLLPRPRGEAVARRRTGPARVAALPVGDQQRRLRLREARIDQGRRTGNALRRRLAGVEPADGERTRREGATVLPGAQDLGLGSRRGRRADRSRRAARAARDRRAQSGAVPADRVRSAAAGRPRAVAAELAGECADAQDGARVRPAVLARRRLQRTDLRSRRPGVHGVRQLAAGRLDRRARRVRRAGRTAGGTEGGRTDAVGHLRARSATRRCTRRSFTTTTGAASIRGRCSASTRCRPGSGRNGAGSCARKPAG